MYVSTGFEEWILELVVVAISFFNLFKYQIKMDRATKEQSQKSTDRFNKTRCRGISRMVVGTNHQQDFQDSKCLVRRRKRPSGDGGAKSSEQELTGEQEPT